MHLKQSIYHAPFSSLILVWDEVGAVRAIEFGHHEARLHRLLRAHYGEYDLQPGETSATIVGGLDAYFAGEFAAVEAIPASADEVSTEAGPPREQKP